MVRLMRVGWITEIARCLCMSHHKVAFVDVSQTI